MTMMTPPPIAQKEEEMLVPPHSEFPEAPQPMEVPRTEASSTGENQQLEAPPSFRFTWTIENFSRLNFKKYYSEFFLAGGFKWRVLIFPNGKNIDHLSMYLEVADPATFLYGPNRLAQFNLAVINQLHSKFTIRKDTRHQFNPRESDWGFTFFMPLSDLYDLSRGYLVNDTVVVEAEVAVRLVLFCIRKSIEKTGYVGLMNQGATCYMNSLLQTLYHIPYFRKAVYHMPTTENDSPSGSIPLALQSLFYKLQYCDSSVATKELTKSFGWDTHDSFMQHDVQELNRVLCEKLEDKMKGTVVEGTIQQLFEGHHMNYIECINVDYKSRRKESFYDLQLDVKGCRDVYASFDKYVEVERLEGDNKYHAEQYGLQDAKKGVLFIDFPPVLQLQLKRFEYDYMRDTMVKINDRYEFPLQLDLDRDNGKYLSLDADRSVHNLYTLHSVLVHSGGVHGGHYYAFIRPTLSAQWFKFDDKRVTNEEMKRALEGQYGGEGELPQTNPVLNNAPLKFTKYSNAYMLVYIRESDKDKIICSVDENDIAEHLRIRLKKELEEKDQKKKEKAGAYCYTVIKVSREEDLAQQIGRDIYFDLVDHEKVHSFRIRKEISFKSFKEEVAKEFGIPVQFQRFWLWAKRQNHTYRPHRPLSPLEEGQRVAQMWKVSHNGHDAELRLFLEVELGDSGPVCLPDRSKEDILLFFKLYDPAKEELRYVGRLFVMALGRPADILSKLNEMAGFSPNEEIELYKEIKFEPTVMCEHIDKKLYFTSSQLEDGDIICYQKCRRDNIDQCRYQDIPSFLEYVHSRQVVHFRSLEKPKEDDFLLELSKLHTYDDVVERLAHHLGLDDPTKIRLTSHNCYSQQPKSQPIKYRGVEHLSDMLVHYNQISDILYYEVLDIPLPELQGLKTLKVAFHHATKDEVVIHSVRLSKNSFVGDVINDLKTKVELSHPDAELRLLEVFYHKIYKIFPPNEKIENINDQYWTLCAEEIPEEEKNLGPQDRLIHVYHFMTDQYLMQVQNFGKPFFLIVRDGETMADVKVRIQKKLQVPDEEFSKWKFAFLSLGWPEYLQDSDVVSNRLQRRDVYGAWEQYLGLEHSAPKMDYQVNQVVHFRSLEKPKEDDFLLELSRLHTYDDVVERVAHHLGLDDPTKVRLTSHNCYSQQPKTQPIKYHGVEHLSGMLVHYNQISYILYYEVLDIPLPELQGLKSLKVAFHHATKDEVVILSVRLPKNSIVGDVINYLKTKVELSHPDAELRLLEIFDHKIYKIFPPSDKIENIDDQYWTLRAEEIPEEEKNLGPQDHLIHVYHFMTDQYLMQVQNFGEPFFLIVRDGETLVDVKVRIQKKLQVPDEEFSKWKFAFLSLGRPEYLQDSDVVYNRFQRRDVYGTWEQFLGLEHSAPKMDYQVNPRCDVYGAWEQYLGFEHSDTAPKRAYQVVHFRSLEKPKEDDFLLVLSNFHTYDDVVERVAPHLGLDDPTKIRLTSHYSYSRQSKPQPIKYRCEQHLSNMFVRYNQIYNIFYYEVLDIPLPELQGLKTLEVAFHHATEDEVVIHNVRLPKNSIVSDVINDLKTKVELSHPDAELRLLEVFYHKIYKIFPPNEKIEDINDEYSTLRAEEIPEEEKNLGLQDRLIHVCHFLKDQNQMKIQNFGEPFFLILRDGEILADVKVRIQKKLEVPDKEFSKWKFAFFSLGRPGYLHDSDVVSDHFQIRDVYGAGEQYLGLEHSDTAPKRAYQVNQNRHNTFEKPIKIYN